jgi:prolyl oligopeptidase
MHALLRRTLIAMTLSATALSAAAQAPATKVAKAPADPYLWLEDVTGKKALDWVEKQNAITFKELKAHPEFEPTNKRLLDILNDRRRIPYVDKMGDWYVNFWRDDKNVRGIWRRTTLEEYRKPEPKWETILDLDALAAAEKENWVWAGASCLTPPQHPYKCVISLSRGGGDATVVREFDFMKKEFVKGGFELPEAKSSVTWRSPDELYVGTDFGAGSLTTSGYPRVIKLWKRGTPLASAVTVFEGKSADVSAFAWVDHTLGFFREGFGRSPDFYTNETFVLQDGKPVKYDVPADAQAGAWREWITVSLRSDWTVGGRTYKAGSLLAARFDAFMKGERRFDVLFEPTERSSLASSAATRSAIVLNINDNVQSRVQVLRPDAAGSWQRREMKLPGRGNASAYAVDPDESDALWLNYTDFLSPDALYLTDIQGDPKDIIKQRPTYFDAAQLQVQQFEAMSKDGTKVPYFAVMRKDLKFDGKAPTLLYGYGGFEVSMEPFYSGSVGTSWLARGGVYLLANIRGGGEFGPRWHQAALKANRQKAFDDFAAVAEDAIKRRITSARHLGIMGGSNGGLLVSAVMVQRPELFRAVVCQVPLTDMRRYHTLLAGASWMAEYGNPDLPEEWAYISKYSPYQNVKKGVKMPRVLFTTSTRDDRVHPGHARKMYAKMKAQGHDVLYYENTEGGHAGAADNVQTAKLLALEWTFLWNQLK